MRFFLLPVLLTSMIIDRTEPAVAAEGEWTRFRGPNGCGVGKATGIPETWTERDYNWKIELPGKGFSSPVISDDRLYVTSTIEEQTTSIVL